jgi:RNA polymerase sigma factor (sigma-70 family)
MVDIFLSREKKLIKRLQSCDHSAYQELVDQYGRYIYSICMNILKKPEEAEEAMQDVFMKVINNISTYNHQSGFKTWLYTIAFRTAIDLKRKRKYHDDISNYYDIQSNQSSADGIYESEKKMLVAKLLKQLDPESERIVKMFYLEELCIKEVAEIMGLQENNIKIKLHRARKKLLESYQNHQELIEWKS